MLGRIQNYIECKKLEWQISYIMFTIMEEEGVDVRSGDASQLDRISEDSKEELVKLIQAKELCKSFYKN